MENWENKTMGDMLNSLQDLPAGYTPDLSAKWEIVEAGLPTNKKYRITPLSTRWLVAAAVLLAIGLVWVNVSKKTTDGLVVKKQTTKPVLVFQQEPPIKNKQFATDTHLSLVPHPLHPTTTITNSKKAKPAKESAYQPAFEMATILSTGRDEDTNQGNSSGQVVVLNDSLSPIANRQTDVVTTLPEKKSAKKKIYQRDFNDGILVMDTGFAPASRQHLSIQLNPFRHKAGDDEQQPGHRLQLKQAL